MHGFGIGADKGFHGGSPFCLLGGRDIPDARLPVAFELALGCVARFAAGNFRQPIAVPSKEQLTPKNVFADGGGIATPAVDTNSRAEALSCHDQSLACFVQKSRYAQQA